MIRYKNPSEKFPTDNIVTPIAILMKTEMGNGVDFMMNTHAWHGKAPNDDQLKIALSQNPITLGDY